MQNHNQSELESLCRDFVIAFHGLVSWKWDSRFDTALAEFPVDTKDSVRALLDRYLSVVWDSSNIGKAPDIVQMIASRLTGIKSGQLLFTSAPIQDMCMFGAWWPWGNGETISLRVAPYGNRLSDSDSAELNRLFKGWFGL